VIQPSGSPYPLMSDDLQTSTIVELAMQGNTEAFEKLFQQYTSAICIYLARMVGNDEEGRDLAQETFIRAWRTLPGLKDVTRFTPWLYRIATNIAIDHLRAKKFDWTRITVFGQDLLAQHTRSYDSSEDQIGASQSIQQALARVKPKYRACLLLQIEAGFSQREIAQLLHMNEKSIGVYVKRGCEQFRLAYKHLEQEHIS
jgi:RNA polymerase sigma-70 factor (ECF subfamily)